MDVALVVLSAPVPGPKNTAELPEGYTLAPLLPEHSTNLLLEAIPNNEGTIHYTGRVTWTGLKHLDSLKQPKLRSTIAITDFHLLFFWWNEQSERYEALIRLPYTEVYLEGLQDFGPLTSIKLCHEKPELMFDDQELTIDRETQLGVLNSANIRDKEKTKEVFTLLESLINQDEELGKPLSPCDEEIDPAGFGESEIT